MTASGCSAAEIEVLLACTAGHSTAHASASEESLENVIGINVLSKRMSAMAAAATVQIFDVVTLVVTVPLLRVRENAVGLADLLEFLLLLSLFRVRRVGVTI